MATGKRLKAAILTRRVTKGPRKKRTRPEPRQYTIADLKRARDRIAAAERRIDNERLGLKFDLTEAAGGDLNAYMLSELNRALIRELEDRIRG